jgi:hypothetical protein
MDARAMESKMELCLLRKVAPELTASATLGLIRGAIEHVIRDTKPPDAVVSDVLMVSLRGVTRGLRNRTARKRRERVSSHVLHR